MGVCEQGCGTGWEVGELEKEVGNETYFEVYVLLESSALSQPIFTLIGNDDFYTNLVWKSLCF